MVHQHFMLADNLTVTENVVLGQEPGSAVWLDFDAAEKRIDELGEIYGLPVQAGRRSWPSSESATASESRS